MKTQYLKIFQLKQYSEQDIDRFLLQLKTHILSLDPSFYIKLFAGRHYPGRTIPQNSYYWVLMTIYGDYVGMTKKEADAWWKGELKPTKPVTNTKTGEVRLVPISTSDMTTQELNNYIEKIKEQAMIQDNIYLPDPGEAIQLTL